MRPTVRLFAIAACAVLALHAAGCAKKAVQTAPPPPTTTPGSGTVPTPGTTPPTTPPATTPGTLTPAEAAALVRGMQTVFFALDSWSLDDGARAALDANARVLRDNPSLAVTVEGHCDERGTVEYNQALGEKRAEAVKQYFADAGIAMSRMVTVSYGKERPSDEGHDEAAWSRNRRAEFSPR